MTLPQAIDSALNATVVEGSTGFVWFGKRPPGLLPRVRRALSAEARRDYLFESLTDCLYSNFYCQGFAAPAEWHGVPAGGDADRTPELCGAAAGEGRWDAGWVVTETASDRLRVERDDLTLTLFPHEFRADECSRPLVGSSGSIHLPKALAGISPGFLMILGDHPECAAERDIVRIYWNVTARGVPALIAALTASLNAAGIPFRFKALKAAETVRRCDAAVLYLAADCVDNVLPIAARIREDIAPAMRPLTPVFTERLAAGIGLAEQPGGEASFGAHRCRLVAEAMLTAHERGQRSLEHRRQAVVATFERAGLSLDAPYLNPGSLRRYRWPTMRPRVVPGPASSSGHRAVLRHGELLETAHRIGVRLAREALWHEDRCTWIGPFPSNEASTSRSLGPELYSGTAGVALFLGELAAVTGDCPLASTARAALRQAWHVIDRLRPAERLGLFSGWPGIAYAATRVGRVLRDDGLLDRARALLVRAVDERLPDGALDLMAGHAGAVLTMLAVGDDGPAERIDLATVLADELLDRAVIDDDACSWPGVNDPREHNLTGLSHGAAGIGLALAELWSATGEHRYRDAARRAFAYERRWFDAGARNWPDLRGIRVTRSRVRGALPFSCFWCHGAAGIALSRIRAFELLRDVEYRDQANQGLDTVRAWVLDMLESWGANFSLCHGLAGNAEVLRVGAERLGSARTGDLDVIHDVARAGRERHADGGDDWPCAAGGGPAPGLMLGLAGIGHFYLRLYDSAIAPILLPLTAARA